MPFTGWGPEYSGGSAIGPLNSGASERRMLTVKNTGPNTIWLSLGQDSALPWPLADVDGNPLNAAIFAGETVTFGVLPGESYYYAVVNSSGQGANVLVWEG